MYINIENQCSLIIRMDVKFIFYKEVEFPKMPGTKLTPQIITNCFREAGFLSENSENVTDEEIKPINQQLR